MTLPTELDKAESEIKDLEHRATAVRDGVVNIEKEITLLSLKELALSDNINNLKRNSVIVLAAEFRRSKEEITKTQTRLAIIRKEKSDLEKALAQTIKVLNKSRLKLNDLLKEKENNVLQGRFGK